MARQRSPDSEKAETLYRKGMKLADIADRLGVPAATVRRWKSTQHWDESKKGKPDKSERSKRTAKASAKRTPDGNVRKRGGQKNNVNAVGGPGGAAPFGNQNAVKHGAYRQPNLDLLSDEEREMLLELEDDEETQLIYQIHMYTVSERRMIKAMNKLMGLDENAAGGMGLFVEQAVREESKRTFKNKEEEEQYRAAIQKQIDKGDRLPGEFYKLTTVTRSTIDQVLRIQQQLTTVQSKKTEAIKALYQLRMDRKKLDAEENGNVAVHAWIEALMDIEGGGSNG